MKPSFTLLLLSLFAILSLQAQNPSTQKCKHKFDHLNKTGSGDNLRSDTIDVLDYNITLDFSNVGNEEISGICQVKFSAKQNNISSISLDLLQLTVDSIKQNGTLLSYSYNDTLLISNLNTLLNIGEIDSITVFYHGHPQGDPSGWGGFYFQGNYSYNLGVGFGADPHNYGRVWHPCFDNFVERATYNITLLTPGALRGYANGVITSEIDHGGYFERTWQLNQEIPTYLACVAVSDYTHVNQNYHSNLTGTDIPMYLIATAADTTKLKSSFTHLDEAMTSFETSYGPYLWDKVGFHLVPFSSGAMEHATSIAYPRATADGTTSYETLMAHELSHHWWGDLVTCRTDQDMWINEGLASYSERIFLESVYGYSTYITNIKYNHKDVLLNAHVRDSGYYPISGVPHSITYGDHSYNKGADVAHNLRGYMGDNEFFNGIQSFLNDYAFTDVDAYDFRDHLNANTSIDVTDFFDDWVFNSGYPGFIIDSSIISQNGNNYDIEVFIHQKLKGTSHFSSNVPLEIKFIDNDWNDTTAIINCSGEFSSGNFTLPFYPEMIYLNPNDKLSIAVTGEDRVVKTTGTKDLSLALFRYVVDNTPDSSLVRVEHYWVAPDPFKNPNNEFAYYLSEERFWKVDGIWADDFHATGKVYFTGKPGVSSELDPLLSSMPGFHEDSLRLLYRPNASSNWSLVEDYSISTIGSATDARAYITFDTLKKGEYTFGWRKSPVSVEEYNKTLINIFPNPVNDWLSLSTNLNFGTHTTIRIYNSLGELVLNTKYWSDKINVSIFPPGIYFMKIEEFGLQTQTLKFIKE